MNNEAEMAYLSQLADTLMDDIAPENDKQIVEHAKAAALVSIALSLAARPPVAAPAPQGSHYAPPSAVGVQAAPARFGAAVGFAIGDRVQRAPFGAGKVLDLRVSEGHEVAVVEYDSNGSIQEEWLTHLQHSNALVAVAAALAAAPILLRDDDPVGADDIDVEIPIGGAASADTFPADFDDDFGGEPADGK